MAPTPQRPLPKPVSPEEQPIINSPFYLPEYHWPLNSDTKAFAPAACGRRTAQNMPPVAGSRGNRRGTPQPGNIGVNWEELKLVNQVRQGVLAWRQSGYPGTTSTTRELINHWTDRDEFPLYFAQIDAVLTHIYLRETRPTDITKELERINLKYNDGIDRLAHKMATATGKTPVMAMLILWQAANQYASGQENSKFVRRFLLLTPGLTVRERLQDSLDPRNPNNDWKTFNLIPPGDLWEPALASASVKIANYHQLEPRTLGLRPSDKGQLLIDGGSRPTTPEELDSRVETPAEMVERISDGKTQRGNILVINDEGHHCHRGDPDRPNQSDTQWFAGIRQIRDASLLAYVTDMSRHSHLPGAIQPQAIRLDRQRLLAGRRHRSRTHQNTQGPDPHHHRAELQVPGHFQQHGKQSGLGLPGRKTLATTRFSRKHWKSSTTTTRIGTRSGKTAVKCPSWPS